MEKSRNFEKLEDLYIFSPFSILNVRSAKWQKRKQKWLDLGIKSELGRGVYFKGLGDLQRKSYCATEKTIENAYKAETSIFDPVLCELMYTWFSKKDDFIIDPFAGGSVRGIIASELQRNYLGLELREEQVKANIENANEICTNYIPKWLIGDSEKTLDTLENRKYDMCLSCPPYVNLEVYSDNPDDLSNMSYENFLKKYQNIILKLYEKMKFNSFCVWVVGEVRNKNGNYYNFVGDTVKCFLNAGFNYYNELILVNPVGTAMLRAKKCFEATKKIVKIHQNVLIFVKGDAKMTTLKIGNVDYQKEYDLNSDKILKEKIFNM